MAILTVDGAAMPSPSEMQIAYKDYGKAETAALGNTVMDRIAVKRTITATFAYLTPDDAKLLLTAIKNALFFDLAVYDPLDDQETIGTFRCTNCSLSPVRYVDNAPIGYVSAKITMEER